MTSQYDRDLDQRRANHTPLSPLSFLPRTAAVFGDYSSVVHGDQRFTWSETFERCRRLASALGKLGAGKGRTVAVMAPNTPPAFECAFGAPATGAILNMLNVRLDADTIAFILEHGDADIVLTDTEFAPTMKVALSNLSKSIKVVDIDDPAGTGGERLGEIEYEDLLASGDPDYAWSLPEDEWDAIALNYTSGTTGNPKGVVYHHRGAYLNSLGNVLVWNMQRHPVYLWTLPMFHCNGWCFPWTITALAGTHVCLRRVEAKPIFDALADERVTHLCGAPVVMNLLVHAPEADKRQLPHQVEMMTAASAPPAAVLEKIEAQGFRITHVYGLTEVYGPATTCEWRPEWDQLPPEERANIKARQGVNYPVLEELTIREPETYAAVPADGETIGEVFMRGNIVMKGYLKNPSATEAAFDGGWFHTGDLGVLHADGYIELKDRSKDIIISGGENISTIEVEGVLYRHPDVLEAAVVARPDEKWGETPCAFVTLRDGAVADATAILDFCRENMAHFKCPRSVVFGPLPKTSTGKIQKYVLREQAAALEP